ncbi:MAG: S-layer homology domain-containing protein [Solibacillus sp.]
MRKWFVTGALSVGVVVSSFGLQAQAAEQVVASNVLSAEAFAANEVHNLTYQDLYKLFKVSELGLPGVKTTMNDKKTEFIADLPVDSLIEAEYGTADYNAEYKEYQALFGKTMQIKITQSGKSFNVTVKTVEGWEKLEGEDKAEFLSGFIDTELELKSGGFFTDTIGHWAESYIQVLYQADIVNGTSDTTFNPNGQVTRGQLVAMIFRASSLDVNEDYEGPATYTDLANFWGAKEVAILEEYGLLDIFAGSKFEPNKPVTREEMAYVTTYFLGMEGIDLEALDASNAFKDTTKMNEEAVGPIGVLQNLEIVGGENGNFNPKGNLTRAQFAKILTLSLYLFEEE